MDSDGRNGDPQPFTTTELENYAAEWSLSCDMRLLSNFKSLSGALFGRADQVLASIDEVVYKTEDEAVKVSNVVNDLQMLQTNQFIENRVYEESEETIAPVNDVPDFEAVAGDQQNIMSKIRSSLNEGMTFVRNNVPDFDIEEDSDEEENIRLSVRSNLRQHRFLTRKLPPLVGGHEFSRGNFVSLFRSRDSPEVVTDAVDAVTAITQKDTSDNSDEERQSEADIVISSSSDSDDMFMAKNSDSQPPHTLNSSLLSKSANIFSDSSSPEPDSIPTSTTSVLPTNPLSFQDELSRRLQSKNRQEDSIPKSSASTTIAANLTDAKTLVNEPQRDASSDISVPGSAFRDRLTDLFSDPDDAPSPPATGDHNFVKKSSENDARKRQPVNQQQAVTSVKPIPASRKLLDFLSDDDDDEFNIFKTKPASKGKQTEKVSKLFSESSDSGSDERINDRKGLPAKDSNLRRGPEKEVSDARGSETSIRQPAPVVDVGARRNPRNKTASLFSPGDASSDEDDLFSSKVLPADPQTSINTSAKSQVKDLGQQKVTPDKHVVQSKPESSDDSDSSAEMMNRSAIASKLEKTIFGNKARKPAGAISLFGESASAKQTSKEPPLDLKDENSVPTTTDSKGEQGKDCTDPHVHIQPQKDHKALTKNVDSDIFAANVLTKSTTLSSQALKSRPRVQNRRKPSRAAVKPALVEQGDTSDAKSPLITSSSSNSKHVVAESTDKRFLSEAKNTGSINSDVSDGRSKPLVDQDKIPDTDPQPLEAENPNPASDPQQKTKSSETPAASVKKSILFGDSDEELFTNSPQQVSATSAPVTATSTQHSTTTAIKTISKNKGLFSDSEDDDIFPMTKKKVTPANDSSVKAGHSLFDSSDEEGRPHQSNDMKKTASAATTTTNMTTDKADESRGSGAAKVVPSVRTDVTKKKDGKQSILFSDDSDDDDLFTPKQK